MIWERLYNMHWKRMPFVEWAFVHLNYRPGNFIALM